MEASPCFLACFYWSLFEAKNSFGIGLSSFAFGEAEVEASFFFDFGIIYTCSPPQLTNMKSQRAVG